MSFGWGRRKKKKRAKKNKDPATPTSPNLEATRAATGAATADTSRSRKPPTRTAKTAKNGIAQCPRSRRTRTRPFPSLAVADASTRHAGFACRYAELRRSQNGTQSKKNFYAKKKDLRTLQKRTKKKSIPEKKWNKATARRKGFGRN